MTNITLKHIVNIIFFNLFFTFYIAKNYFISYDISYSLIFSLAIIINVYVLVKKTNLDDYVYYIYQNDLVVYIARLLESVVYISSMILCIYYINSCTKSISKILIEYYGYYPFISDFYLIYLLILLLSLSIYFDTFHLIILAFIYVFAYFYKIITPFYNHLNILPYESYFYVAFLLIPFILNIKIIHSRYLYLVYFLIILHEIFFFMKINSEVIFINNFIVLVYTYLFCLKQLLILFASIENYDWYYRPICSSIKNVETRRSIQFYSSIFLSLGIVSLAQQELISLYFISYCLFITLSYYKAVFVIPLLMYVFFHFKASDVIYFIFQAIMLCIYLLAYLLSSSTYIYYYILPFVGIPLLIGLYLIFDTKNAFIHTGK